MKKLLTWTLTALLLCLPALALAGEDAEPQVQYFPWLDTVLGLDWVAEEDGTGLAMGTTAPEGQRMLRLHIVAGENTIPTEEIDPNLQMFTLRDAESELYKPMLSVLTGVAFDPETALFSTNEEQASFDLVFLVPEDAAITDLVLLVDLPNPDEKVIIRLENIRVKEAEEEAA